jgi:histone deacetylase 6
MELVNLCDVEQRVKAVVQVGGLHSLVRVDPHNESKRNWFKMVNRVYVPNIHPLLNEERLHRRLGGQINTSQKAQVVDVLVDVFPQIQEFVESKLPKPTTTPAPSSNGNSNGNGHADAAMPQPQPVLA